MTDEKELRNIAVNSALELARGKNKTAAEVVKDAETIHDFLAPKETEKDESAT